jgi:hypothetical protein
MESGEINFREALESRASPSSPHMRRPCVSSLGLRQVKSSKIILQQHGIGFNALHRGAGALDRGRLAGIGVAVAVSVKAPGPSSRNPALLMQEHELGKEWPVLLGRPTGARIRRAGARRSAASLRRPQRIATRQLHRRIRVHRPKGDGQRAGPLRRRTRAPDPTLRLRSAVPVARLIGIRVFGLCDPGLPSALVRGEKEQFRGAQA